MKFTFAGVFADAGALFRAERDLVLRVAGLFLFLPVLAIELFLPPLPQLAKDAGEEAITNAIMGWMGQNWGWIALEYAALAYGGGVLLTLLLDRARPTLGQALLRTLQLLPMLLVGWAIVLFATSLGSVALLLVVGLYVAGRLLLTGAVLVAEPGTNPLAAIAQSFRYTRRRGWLLAAVAMLVMAASFAAALVPASIAVALIQSGAASPFILGPLKLLAAVANAGGWLALILIQASTYRFVREGI